MKAFRLPENFSDWGAIVVAGAGMLFGGQESLLANSGMAQGISGGSCVEKFFARLLFHCSLYLPSCLESNLLFCICAAVLAFCISRYNDKKRLGEKGLFIVCAGTIRTQWLCNRRRLGYSMLASSDGKSRVALLNGS